MTKRAIRKGHSSGSHVTPQKTLTIHRVPDTDDAGLLARTALRPSVRAALTTQTFSKQFGELDLMGLIGELAHQAKTVNGGALERPEAMLVAQAHTLEAIFHELARRSAANLGEYLGAAETYMRLALKAQSQCRATIEALAEIKNPKPVAFVQQANIANGPQQVNNAGPTNADASRAGEIQKTPNELLEQANVQRLDNGATQAAIGANQEVATVGALDRPEDPCR